MASTGLVFRSDQRATFQSTYGKNSRAQRRGKTDDVQHLAANLSVDTLRELAAAEIAKAEKAHEARTEELRLRRRVLEQDRARYEGNRAYVRQLRDVTTALDALDSELALALKEHPAEAIRAKVDEYIALLSQPMPAVLAPEPPPSGAKPATVAGAAVPKAPAAKKTSQSLYDLFKKPDKLPSTAVRPLGPTGPTGPSSGAAGPPPAKQPVDSEPMAAAQGAASAAQKLWNAQIATEFRADVQGVRTPWTVNYDQCPHCHVPMVLTETNALLKCPTGCGRMQPFLDTTVSTKGYGEDCKTEAPSDYKRATYYRDRMTKAQAQQGPQVQDHIVKQVEEFITKEWRIPKEKIKATHVARAVRKLALAKCYDYAPQIYTRITGKLPPQMTPEQERKLASMFDVWQKCFDDNKHLFFAKKKGQQTRLNSLSYTYCINKFCMLNGWHDLAAVYPLPKTASRLEFHENVFEYICRQLRWQFIPSPPANCQKLKDLLPSDEIREEPSDVDATDDEDEVAEPGKRRRTSDDD